LSDFLPSEKLTIAIRELTRFDSRSGFARGTPVMRGLIVADTTTMDIVTVIIRMILSLFAMVCLLVLGPGPTLAGLRQLAVVHRIVGRYLAVDRLEVIKHELPVKALGGHQEAWIPSAGLDVAAEGR
jgi:hypothetical protein